MIFSKKFQKNFRPENNKIIAIVGPTVSGKSALAVKIAKKLNGEIISADSRQVYKGLNLASGKINKKEMKGVKHYCLDLVSPKTVFTAQRFQKCAAKAIKTIIKKGKIPIIAGGTGFYIDAALGRIKIPEIPPDWKLRRKLELKSAPELLLLLKKFDYERAAAIEPQNKRRLIRAVEIAKHFSQKKTGKKPKNEINQNLDILWLGIKTEPEELKNKINARLKRRIKDGMIAEIKKMNDAGISRKRLDSLGLEPRWISRYLHGHIARKEMTEKLQNAIWRYSRRQMTWFKRNKKIHWVKTSKEAENLLKKFLL
jgi:tRNA dimethylallyltransferase